MAPNPWGAIQRRRIAAALTLSGLAVLAPVVGHVLSRAPQASGLHRESQTQRVLPLPNARRLDLETRVNPPFTRPRPAATTWSQLPRPVRLRIPAIGVSAPIISLGLEDDGAAETPDSAADAGWFAPGPEPGEQGSALIIGHVDSYRGPGVFYHLPALRRGDRITVVLRDRRRVPFVVTGFKEAPKAGFPTKLVFRHTKRPTLRLVTCGGAFDRSTQHYVDNFIVFAHLAQV